jgi:ABC-type phosphate transport system substrate-binding protein
MKEYCIYKRRQVMKKLAILLLSVLCIATLSSLSYAEDLKIDGSTTVLPIAQRAAELFMKNTPM